MYDLFAPMRVLSFGLLLTIGAVAAATTLLPFPLGMLTVAVFVAALTLRPAAWRASVLTFAVALVLLPAFAYAADGAAPETVAQATGDTTKVTWAYGAIIQQWAGAVSTLIMVAIAFALRQLPAQVYAILVSMRAEQLLQKALDYATNMVENATAGKSLSVDVHNEVLKQALQYVLDNAPGWLTSWLGGPDQIATKLIARMNIAPDVAGPDASAAVAAVK